MRMERRRLAVIRPRWTPDTVTLTQAPLLLSEQDRHADPSGEEMGAGAGPPHRVGGARDARPELAQIGPALRDTRAASAALFFVRSRGRFGSRLFAFLSPGARTRRGYDLAARSSCSWTYC